MDCGGKRSATPLWLRAERAPEPEATLSTTPVAVESQSAVAAFALPAHSIIGRTPHHEC